MQRGDQQEAKNRQQRERNNYSSTINVVEALAAIDNFNQNATTSSHATDIPTFDALLDSAGDDTCYKAIHHMASRPTPYAGSGKIKSQPKTQVSTPHGSQHIPVTPAPAGTPATPAGTPAKPAAKIPQQMPLVQQHLTNVDESTSQMSQRIQSIEDLCRSTTLAATAAANATTVIAQFLAAQAPSAAGAAHIALGGAASLATPIRHMATHSQQSLSVTPYTPHTEAGQIQPAEQGEQQQAAEQQQ